VNNAVFFVARYFTVSFGGYKQPANLNHLLGNPERVISFLILWIKSICYKQLGHTWLLYIGRIIQYIMLLQH